MTKRLQLSAALCFLVLQAAVAQVNTYAFAQGISQYSAALTGSFIGYSYQDDTVNTVNLPFTFKFNGNNYNSTNISSNGFISFAAINANVISPLSNSSTQNVISAFGQDLHSGILVTCNLSSGSNTITNISLIAGLSVGDSIADWNGDFSNPYPRILSISGNNIVVNANANVNASGYDLFIMNGRIRQKLYGVSPNRMCEIEFRNFSRFNVYNEMINFKIRLWETIERITMVYGSATAGNTTSYSEIGLKGTSTADFKSRKVGAGDSYISSQPATVITDGCLVASTHMPFGGVTYTWRPVCPIPNYTVTQTDTSICAGESVTLTAGPASFYSWNGTDSTAQIVVTPTASSNYSLFAMEGPCTHTQVLHISYHVPPVVNVSQSSGMICMGQNATLTATGASSYSWTNVGPGQQVVVSPTAHTTYTVTGTANDCSTQAFTTVSVTPLPSPSVTTSHSMACVAQQVVLTASGASSYSWSTGSTGTSINAIVVSTTTFALTGFNGSCSSQTIFTQQVKFCPGITEHTGAGRVSVYPNPFATAFNVQNQGAAGRWSITVTDVTGKCIQRIEVENSGATQVDAGSWSSGVYFLSVTDGQGTVTSRLMKD